MSWVPLIAWLGAVVVAAVVLGFCAYELTWKARRVRADLVRLQQLGDSLRQLQDDVTAAQLRLVRTGAR